jgi:hypothetical protein
MHRALEHSPKSVVVPAVSHTADGGDSLLIFALRAPNSSWHVAVLISMIGLPP